MQQLGLPLMRRIAGELVRGAVDSASRPVRGHDGACRRLAWFGLDLRERAVLELDEGLEAMPELHVIPSETTHRERAFLYTYFARLWPGEGHVVEIGPFFGGTTRAIALGMLANPRRVEHARLFTYDRFEDYYDADDLAQRLRGCLDPDVLAAVAAFPLRRRGNFRQAFKALHAGTPYEELLVVRSEPLPDTPAQAAEGDALQLDYEADGFFVDGCKSWQATRHLLIQVARCGRRGATLIFQDYGWRTCFWIPAALYALREWLAPFASVDTTRALQVRRPLGPADVEARVPETPEQGGRLFFDVAFDSLQEEARRCGGRRAALRYSLQHAAALAYLGHVDEARERLEGLLSDNRFSEDRPLIEDSLRSPTYRPDGTRIQL